MKILILDGHPDEGRLISHLLDHYAASAPAGVEVQRIAMRDLAFEANLSQGYKAEQGWGPNLVRLASALDACD
ncbi:NAD(P)H-dependent oxidoreductase, partial [Clostridioides difficile]|uniref:NAD(P)H-dependent oxidoreductase n=1 Tax=Clostridioides difficile TaxID=1496 RepID=UPI0018DD4604